MWLNCLRFWLELQEYHKLFFAKVFDAFALKKKAQVHWSTDIYLMKGHILFLSLQECIVEAPMAVLMLFFATRWCCSLGRFENILHFNLVDQ